MIPQIITDTCPGCRCVGWVISLAGWGRKNNNWTIRTDSDKSVPTFGRMECACVARHWRTEATTRGLVGGYLCRTDCSAQVAVSFWVTVFGLCDAELIESNSVRIGRELGMCRCIVFNNKSPSAALASTLARGRSRRNSRSVCFRYYQ